MKRPPLIDFVAPRPRKTPQIAVAVLAAAALLASLSAVWQASRENSEELSQTRRAETRSLRAPAALRTALPAGPARAVRGQLAAPWDDLLTAFEEHSTADIGLLRLEPDAGAALVRVVGQARDTDAMIAYLAALETDPRLANVLLTSHQPEGEIAGRPVTFTLSASWQQAAPQARRLAQESSHDRL